MTNYLAKNLKFLRENKKIDQQVMAEDLGIAQSTLSCWENGLRSPNLDMVAKIKNYLNIHDDFISEDLTTKNSSFSSNSNDELELLFKKNKDILTEDDKETIKFLIEKRKREIDKQNHNE